MLAILIDPDVFGTAETFGIDLDKYTDWVKASPPAPGFDAVELPGDPERRTAAERSANGIFVDDGTRAQLLEAAASVGVPQSELDALTTSEES